MRSVDPASGPVRGVVCRGLKTTDLHSRRAMVEAVFVLLAFGNSAGDSMFASAAWVLVRLGTFAGTVCISALVLRVMGER